MYKRTPFRDRAVDAMKSMEPESTMSTDGENGDGGLFPKLSERRQQRKEERGIRKRGVDATTTRRSDDPQKDFEMFIDEGGAAISRPENRVGGQELTRKQRRALRRRKKGGGATGLDIMNLYK